MGGNKNNSGGGGRNVPPPLINRDLFHRLNYTFQASAFLQHLSSCSSPCSPSSCSISFDGQGLSGTRKRRRKTIQLGIGMPGEEEGEGAEQEGTGLMAVYFGQVARETMRSTQKMAVHNQLKLDPSLKRACCRKCGSVLIPGLTSKIRNRPDRSHFYKSHTTCLTCFSRRSIPIPPVPLPPDQILVAPPSTLQSSEFTPAASGTPLSTTFAEESLDGPIRRKRKEKALKRGRAGFHEREAAPPISATHQAPGVSKGGADVPAKAPSRGHTLWRGGRRVVGWGVPPSLPDIET